MGLTIGGTTGTGVRGGNGGGGAGTLPLPPIIPPVIPGPSELAPVSVAERTEPALATGSPIGVIYGRNLVAPDVFYGRAEASSPENCRTYWGLAFGEGEIQGIESWCVNGTALAGGWLPNLFSYREEKTGTLSQAAVSGGTLGSDFATKHGSLPGLAYVYAELATNGSVLPQAIVQGALLYDPRLGAWSSGDEAPSAYRAYSANPALESADLLTNARYGLGIPTTSVDWTSVTTAADYCDTLVSGKKRYECHVVLRTRETASGWLKTINAHFGGNWIQVGGLWTLFCHKPIAASPVTITAEDMVGSPRLSRSVGAGLADLPNRVTVEWVDPSAGWVTRTTPIVSAEVEAGAPVREGACYKLHGCQDEAQAFRIGWYLLNAMSADLSMDAALLPRNIHVTVGTLISVTDASVGLSGQQFVVTKVTLGSGTVAIHAIEYSSAIWSPSAYTSTALPDPTPSAPPDVVGLAYRGQNTESTTASAGITTKTTTTWLGATYTLPASHTGVRLRVRGIACPNGGSVNPQSYSWGDALMAASEVVVPLAGNLPMVGTSYALFMPAVPSGYLLERWNALGVQTYSDAYGAPYRLIVRVEDADGRLSPGVTLDVTMPAYSTSTFIPTPIDIAVANLTAASIGVGTSSPPSKLAVQADHAYGAGTTKILTLIDAPNGNGYDAGALSFRHTDTGNAIAWETGVIASRAKYNGTDFWGRLGFRTKPRDTSQATESVERMTIYETGSVFIGNSPTADPRALLEITSKPTSIAAGYTGALRINCGSEPDYGSPAANDLVALQVFVNNGSIPAAGLWGINSVVIQSGTPTPGANGIHLVGGEVEVCNSATSGNEQLDPIGSLANKIRGNGFEIVGHSGSARRNAGGLVIWANDTGGTKWFDTGILISRSASTGIAFRRDSGDTVEPFQTALLDGKTLRQSAQTLYRGSDGITSDLYVRNFADFGVYLNLDSGSSSAQEAYLFFGDRGSSKFVIGKTNGNGLVIGYHNRATARTAIYVGDNGSAVNIGLFGSTGTTQQTVTGSRGGNAALTSLLTALAAYGIVINSTTA